MSVSPEVAAILRDARRIAVVGLSDDPFRPSHSVAGYLQGAGYAIVGVHPGGGETLGVRRYPDLRTAAEAEGPIDIVDIFRRSDAVPELLPDLLAVRPRLVWMQLGVDHAATAAALAAAGIAVVQDRCLAVEHRALTRQP
ncbi:MAG TPA: CoA-binding protein [Gemmatimonadales bacterium]|jgi:predicted CoA-binding protein|nr:CoA-binding protein [Gemmatimonadales bacterium]